MKPKNYIILMVAALAAMLFAPAMPCRANWVYLGSDASGGSPDSDSDSDRGTDYWWSWSYDVSGIDRGGDSSGSWATASMTADADAYVYSYTYEATDLSVSPSNPEPAVYGDSYYTDLYPYTSDGLTVDWSLGASGTVTAYGGVDDSDLGSGDSMSSDAFASGDAEAYEYGGGYAEGYVSENSTGSADAGVYGEATEDSAPDITEDPGYYYAKLNFTVYASDSVPGVEADPGRRIHLGQCRCVCGYLLELGLFGQRVCACGGGLWGFLQRVRYTALSRSIGCQQLK
jgi:hypothetical protein